MEKEKYFLIYQHDKEATVREYTKEEFLFDHCYTKIENFLTKIPDSDPGYWDMKYLLIKGKIVVPKEKKVVMELDID